ncbi:hypothetical protein M0R45_020422 [Rubus argutus]|uniref:X8 domain-containing protein n=1 Tax=Rubus argutus TaxID=59490 RepID=A0AAW1XA46_RUBAR
MAAPPLSLLFFFLIVTLVGIGAQGATATWCVARSDASTQALQTALDYACASGADCVPIQPDGLCFLPNTIQARASYAFNSFYQRKAMAPGSCDFSGTATIAQTDPSYGSCVYPSSVRYVYSTSTISLAFIMGFFVLLLLVYSLPGPSVRWTSYNNASASSLLQHGWRDKYYTNHNHNPNPNYNHPNTPTTATTNPTFGNGITGGFTPVATPVVPDDSKAASFLSMIPTIFISVSFIFYLFF